MNDAQGYGLWTLVIINSLVFIIFALVSPSRNRRVTGARLVLFPPSSWRYSPRCTDFR